MIIIFCLLAIVILLALLFPLIRGKSSRKKINFGERFPEIKEDFLSRIRSIEHLSSDNYVGVILDELRGYMDIGIDSQIGLYWLVLCIKKYQEIYGDYGIYKKLVLHPHWKEIRTYIHTEL